jgi:hypothetical protein
MNVAHVSIYSAAQTYASLIFDSVQLIFVTGVMETDIDRLSTKHEVEEISVPKLRFGVHLWFH